jgi:hypothetical protein
MVEPSGIEPLTSCMPCTTDMCNINDLHGINDHVLTLKWSKVGRAQRRYFCTASAAGCGHFPTTDFTASSLSRHSAPASWSWCSYCAQSLSSAVTGGASGDRAQSSGGIAG